MVTRRRCRRRHDSPRAASVYPTFRRRVSTIWHDYWAHKSLISLRRTSCSSNRRLRKLPEPPGWNHFLSRFVTGKVTPVNRSGGGLMFFAGGQ